MEEGEECTMEVNWMNVHFSKTCGKKLEKTKD